MAISRTPLRSAPSPSYLRTQLRDSDIYPLGARNATLRNRVLTMPTVIDAEALGHSHVIAENHANDAGVTWVAWVT